MRFLFDMPYPGFLRYFDSVVQELVDRGHEVDLVWDLARRQPEGLVAVPTSPAVRNHDLPKRHDFWRGPARRVRMFAHFVRFLDRRFSDSHYLRRRAASRIPWPLNRLRTLPDPVVRRLLDLSLALEAVVPRSYAIDKFIARLAPDLVIVSPLVRGATPQNDVIASARGQGFSTAAAIASWDNLTNKSILLTDPDRMLVWNEIQRDEARELHRYPPERVIVTGAQCFDRWFNRSPSRDRAAFHHRVGLPVDMPYFLFVGSTASISAPDAEIKFVRKWLTFLGVHPTLSKYGILVRPHPFNSLHWGEVDLSEFPQATVWPRDAANPVDENDRSDYFDSLYYSTAVVGINTSAMIEAAIVGRPVLTLAVDELHEAQRETVHFQYLLPENGGFVRAARSLEQHAEQLEKVLADPDAVSDELDEFVHRFVRPRGINKAATPIFVDALEELAVTAPEPLRPRGPYVLGLRAMLVLLGLPELPRAVRKSMRRALRKQLLRQPMKRGHRRKRSMPDG